MILGKEEIIIERERGEIIIDPFNENQINPNSYNVRLGNNFYEMNSRLRDSFSVFDLTKDLTKDLNPNIFVFNNIPDDSKFMFRPHTFILGHTKEIVGTQSRITTLLKSRSTIARLGIEVCASAGFGDVGFINHWTLEIHNHSSYMYILKPGMEIAQIAFIEVKGETDKYNSVYNTQEWAPEDMLPKLGKDRFFK